MSALLVVLPFLIGIFEMEHAGSISDEVIKSGGVAQLVEHLVCNQAVVGSNPVASTPPFRWG